MSDPLMKDLVESRLGARIASVMPDLEEQVTKMLAQTVSKALRELQDKTLTPEAALLYWQEYASTKQLLTRLAQQVKIGASAGKTAAPYLESTYASPQSRR